MDAVYSHVLDFLETEISVLSEPVNLPAELVEMLIAETGSELPVKKAIDKINYRKKVYCEKAFTDQTIRHCILQIQDIVKRRIVHVREQIWASQERLAVNVGPDLTSSPYNVSGMSDKELVDLAEKLGEIPSSSGRSITINLADAVTDFKTAAFANSKYKQTLKHIETAVDWENINNNMLKRSSRLVGELKTLQQLCTKLDGIIRKEPDSFKQLMSQDGGLDFKANEFVLTALRPDYA